MDAAKLPTLFEPGARERPATFRIAAARCRHHLSRGGPGVIITRPDGNIPRSGLENIAGYGLISLRRDLSLLFWHLLVTRPCPRLGVQPSVHVCERKGELLSANRYTGVAFNYLPLRRITEILLILWKIVSSFPGVELKWYTKWIFPLPPERDIALVSSVEPQSPCRKGGRVRLKYCRPSARELSSSSASG